MLLNKNKEFIDFFIKKEKTFLYKVSPLAFEHKDFRFYMKWFALSIYDNITDKYDIEKRFTYYFCNNLSLNIIFFTYIVNCEFREKVLMAIIEYKEKYHKEYI